MCWEPASPAVMLITWLSGMGTGAEKGIVPVAFSSFAEQEKGDLPRHDAGRETALLRQPGVLWGGIELMHMLKKGPLVAEERAQHLTPAEQVSSLAA
jgi:hypothetical protein